MTYQEFNHIYYKYSKNKKGIRPMDRITTNGYELKEFVEFAMQNLRDANNRQLTLDSLNF